MITYLVFERRYARVFPGETDRVVYVVDFRGQHTDHAAARRARAGVVQVLREMARRAS